MADNYLERRQEELAQRRAPAAKKRSGGVSLDTLLKKNRSYRGFDPSRAVSEEELKSLVQATTLCGSGMNRQLLRYRLVFGEEAAKVQPLITLGAALPEEHLPKSGMEPGAFIVACSEAEPDKPLWIDLGIAGQSILLKAVEKGLGGIFILNFRANELKAALGMEMSPLAVIAIGKPAENIFLKPVKAGESLKYYRKDGVHFVPKLTLEDILI